MSSTDNNDSPPTYEEIMGETDGTATSTVYIRVKNRAFLLLNFLVSIISFAGVFILSFTNTIHVNKVNATNHCNDPTYNVSPIPKRSFNYVISAIVTTFVICTVLECAKSIINREMKTLFYNVLRHLWFLTMNFVFVYLFVEFVKLYTGVFRPFFFSNQEIKSFYCVGGFQNQSMPLDLKSIDHNLRKSFPSFRSAIYGFCITFCYLYVDHLDTANGLHATQQIIVFAVGTYLYHILQLSWKRGENHLDDIIVGFVIGLIQALIAIRNWFGTVVHSRITISNQLVMKVKFTGNASASTTGSRDDQVSAPPSNPQPSCIRDLNGQSDQTTTLLQLDGPSLPQTGYEEESLIESYRNRRFH